MLSNDGVLAMGVLLVLFWFQRHGTERVGKIFGPVMLVWFAVISILGIRWIVTAAAHVARSARPARGPRLPRRPARRRAAA